MKSKRHSPVAEGFSEEVQNIRKLRTAEQLLNQGQTVADVDVAPGNRSTMDESPHPARLGRGLHHERNPPHTRADHPQAQNR